MFSVGATLSIYYDAARQLFIIEIKFFYNFNINTSKTMEFFDNFLKYIV